MVLHMGHNEKERAQKKKGQNKPVAGEKITLCRFDNESSNQLTFSTRVLTWLSNS